MGMFKVGDLLERRVGKRKESAVVESIFETDGHTLIKARIVVIDEGRVLKTRVQKTLKVAHDVPANPSKPVDPHAHGHARLLLSFCSPAGEPLILLTGVEEGQRPRR